jgi:hypothetical protein
MRGAVVAALFLSALIGGALLFVARVWAEGFDIGRGVRVRWWMLYASGTIFLATGLIGLFLTTQGDF